MVQNSERRFFVFTVIALCIANTGAFSQGYPKFELTSAGVEPIVVQFDSMSMAVLYTKAHKWVLKTYKNPDKVLKANIPNEELRMSGYKEGAYFFKGLGKSYCDLEYTFIIQVKDQKVRLTFTPENSYYQGSKAALPQGFFKKDGTLPNMYKDVKPSLEQTMNELVLSLCDFLNGKGQGKDDW